MFGRIKLSARRALLGEELLFLPGTLLLMAFFLFFSLCNALLYALPLNLPEKFFAAFAFLSAPLSLFVIAPLRHKMQIKYIRFYTGNRERVALNFESGINSCILGTMLFFIKSAYCLFYELLPLSTLAFLIYRLKQQEMSERTVIAIVIGIAVTALIGFVSAFVSVQKYSRASFFLAAYEGISPTEAIRMSKKYSKGKLLVTALFKAEFLPWLILCAAVLPALFVIPYYRQSLTAFFIEY